LVYEFAFKIQNLHDLQVVQGFPYFASFPPFTKILFIAVHIFHVSFISAYITTLIPLHHTRIIQTNGRANCFIQFSFI